MRCGEAGDPERCEHEGACGAWRPAAACENDAFCRDGECAVLTERQRGHKRDLETFVGKLSDSTGSFFDRAIDPAAVLKVAVATMASGGDDDASYYRGARRALLGFKSGHLDLYSAGRCGRPELPELLTSRVGACAQPHGDHAVIAYATEGNALGLLAGDRIVAVDGKRGKAMMDAAFYDAYCGVGSATESNQRFVSAASLLGGLRVGSEVEIVRRDGVTETKTVAKLDPPVLCRFPTPGAHAYPAKATRRKDGVAVIEVPTFLLPTSPPLSEREVGDAIAAELGEVKDAPAIIWDLRGNPGGATMIALAIVSGMPGFEPSVLARCEARKPGSVPFAPAAGRSLTFHPTVDARFSYSGKVAVLVDGLTTSAGDFFALAVRARTGGAVKLVGSPTAGAFGGVGKEYAFGARLPLKFTADESRCVDEANTALEGRALVPDIAVELDPADLAEGRDTVIEAAAAALR